MKGKIKDFAFNRGEISADHVICNNCGEEMTVKIGTERCPNCRTKGMLRWANEKKPEVFR